MLAAVAHLEGAEAIDPELETLPFWHAAGLRSLGPVYSRANAFAHGVPFAFPLDRRPRPGAHAPPARAWCEACADLGIAVDLSHLNEAGFWDVAKLDLAPLIASHSGAHALCPASRNLTDAQLDAIGASGGLVGIVYAVGFIRDDGAEEADTPLSVIADHARYVADRIGAEHVALGSDFDGATHPRRARRRRRPAEAARRAARRRLHRGRARGDRLGQLAARASRRVGLRLGAEPPAGRSAAPWQSARVSAP